MSSQDMQLSKIRLLKGNWKKTFIKEISNVLNSDKFKNIIDNSLPDKRETIFEALENFKKKKKITSFIDLRIILSLFKDFFCDTIDDIKNFEWIQEFYRAVQSLLCAYYVHLEVIFGSGEIIENEFNEFEIKFDLVSNAREKVTEVNELWIKYNSNKFRSPFSIDEFYQRILQLLEIGTRLYMLKLPEN